MTVKKSGAYDFDNKFDDAWIRKYAVPCSNMIDRKSKDAKYSSPVCYGTIYNLFFFLHKLNVGKY